MNWVRYWIRTKNEFILDSNGYLLDPNKNSYYYKESAIATLEDIIEQCGTCTILLGEAGIGKSNELNKLKELADNKLFNTFYYNFEIYKDIYTFTKELSNKINNKNNERISLILIDSFEESMDKYDAEVFKVLIEIFNMDNKGNIKLVLSSRTSYWLKYYEDQLIQIIDNNISKYYLTPLTKENVDDYIYECLNKIEADSLIERINSYRLHSFSRVPINLKLLMGISNDDNEITREKIFRVGCERLCKELNNNRIQFSKRNLNVARKVQVAEWIAFVTMLGCKNTIFINTDFNSEVYGVYIREELVNEDINENEIMEVLNTSLFIAVSEDSYRWSHMSFAEFLCANYIMKNFNEDQINKLIFHPEVKNRVITKLKEVAAWLIQIKPMTDFVTKIIQNDYEVIFLSNLRDYSEDIKKLFILQLMKICTKDENVRIKFLDKAVFKSCMFDGLEEWLNKKLDLLDYFYDNFGNKEIADYTIKQLYEVKNRIENGEILYISDYIINILIEVGIQCEFKSIVDRSLRYIISYYNIEEDIFNSYFKNVDKKDLNELFQKFSGKTYKTDYCVKRLNSKFIVNLILNPGDKKGSYQILDLLNDYCKEIEENDFYKVEYVLKNMTIDELCDWAKPKINRKENKLINLIIDIIFEKKVEFNEKIISFINSIIDNCNEVISETSLKKWISNENNLDILKSKIDKNKLDKFVLTVNNIKSKNETPLNKKVFKKIEQKEIDKICSNIIDGNIEFWNYLVESLLNNNNYDKFLYMMLTTACYPRLDAIQAINWENIKNKDLILNAAIKYFNDYILKDSDETIHHCSVEHDILINILLEECPEFFSDLNEKQLENWIYDIIKFDPINEDLVKILYRKIPQKLLEITTTNIDDKERGCGLIESDLKVLKFVWNEEISKYINRYLGSDSINVYKKSRVFKFLYEINDMTAIEFANKTLEKVNESNLQLQLSLLSTYFSKGHINAFEIFKKLSSEKKGFTAKFIKVLKDENIYFDFLRKYSVEEISFLYIRINYDREEFISEYVREKAINGFKKDFDYFFSAEYEFDRIKKNVLYWLSYSEDVKSLKKLYELYSQFPEDKVVKEIWGSKSDKYLDISWQGTNVYELKKAIASTKDPIINATTKSTSDYSYDDLLEALIFSSLSLQEYPLFRNASENQRNSYISNILEAKGFYNKDQTLRGDSYIGKKPGELDILVVSKSGIPFSVIEALNLDSLKTDYINLHLSKIFRYDSNGLKCNFIIIYSKAKDFCAFWDKYVKYVSDYVYPFEIKEFNIVNKYHYANLRIGLAKHIRNGMEMILYHICINMRI